MFQFFFLPLLINLLWHDYLLTLTVSMEESPTVGTSGTISSTYYYFHLYAILLSKVMQNRAQHINRMHSNRRLYIKIKIPLHLAMNIFLYKVMVIKYLVKVPWLGIRLKSLRF